MIECQISMTLDLFYNCIPFIRAYVLLLLVITINNDIITIKQGRRTIEYSIF